MCWRSDLTQYAEAERLAACDWLPGAAPGMPSHGGPSGESAEHFLSPGEPLQYQAYAPCGGSTAAGYTGPGEQRRHRHDDHSDNDNNNENTNTNKDDDNNDNNATTTTTTNNGNTNNNDNNNCNNNSNINNSINKIKSIYCYYY